jgi:hypothetical protein
MLAVGLFAEPTQPTLDTYSYVKLRPILGTLSASVPID